MDEISFKTKIFAKNWIYIYIYNPKDKIDESNENLKEHLRERVKSTTDSKEAQGTRQEGYLDSKGNLGLDQTKSERKLTSKNWNLLRNPANLVANIFIHASIVSNENNTSIRVLIAPETYYIDIIIYLMSIIKLIEIFLCFTRKFPLMTQA